MNYFEEEIDRETLENEIFLVDVLNMQEFRNVDLYLQCPEEELTNNVKDILIVSEFAWGFKIRLTPQHKEILLSELVSHHLHVWFASVEARLFNTRLFELYDGCVYAEFSKNIEIPQWFVDKYHNSDRYIISNEW